MRSERDGRHVVRERFWCAASEREVEVTFVVRGLPGLTVTLGVEACTSYDPPTAIVCRRRCMDPAFRRQWQPAVPGGVRG